MRRVDVINFLSNADLTSRERDIIYLQELEKIKTLKELSFEYNVEERQIQRIKQNALKKITYQLKTL